MLRTQRLRATAFHPLLQGLARLRVAPDHVTLLSLACGLAFCPLLPLAPALALGALLLHVLLDGLDGPLARHLGTASRRGSFTDTLADQVVVTATTIALMDGGLLGVLPGTIYVFSYAVVVAFAMVRNAMDVPYTWLVRPRFLVYVWLPVEFYLLPGSLGAAVWICAGVLLLKMLSGFVRLRSRL